MDARNRMLDIKEVCEIYKISKPNYYRGMAAGFYPRPYRVGLKSVRWKYDEIMANLDNLSIAVPIEVAPGSKKGRKKL